MRSEPCPDEDWAGARSFNASLHETPRSSMFVRGQRRAMLAGARPTALQIIVTREDSGRFRYRSIGCRIHRRARAGRWQQEAAGRSPQARTTEEPQSHA
jgi:hypothetical protein